MHDAQLEQAYAARQAGQDQQAVALCRQILAADPAHRGARSLIGVCMAEAGDVAGARALVEEAAAAEPGNWRFALNLSALREIEGRGDEAAECARRATTLAPERFEVWARLGSLAANQGDYAGAVPALERALGMAEHPGLALLLAGAAYEIGQYDKAQAALGRFERVAPGHPEALKLRTHLARRGGDVDAFLAAATKWLGADPQSEAARVAVAHGHAQRDDYHRAIEIYRPLADRDADHQATFARYLLWARDFDGAGAYYERALAARPDHADAAAGLARLNIYRGRLDEAARLAGQAIAGDPANVDGYSQLAVATGAQLSDGQLEALRALADDPALEDDNRAVAWFTIGDVHHRRREPEAAFAAWTRANDLKRQAGARWAGSRYDRQETEQMVDRLIASFAAFPPSAPAAGGSTPIFIVGMPRSGTTLLDAALGGHGDIVSAGELPAMPAILKAFLDWAGKAGWRGGPIPAQVVTQLRDGYLRQYAMYRLPGAAFVTDKQPLNFWAAGLIRHLFPAAPIIHMTRDPIETGFSIYRNNFTKVWGFTTSLADIGRYYGQYERMMAHWGAVLGSAMATVRYETLVEDFEGEMRRVLAQFGIGWDPACLTYHERESIVTTLSSTQVRKAPSKDHLGQTAPYAALLGPLREALAKGAAAKVFSF